MTIPLLLLIWAATVVTTLLSGVFGMAGGLLLVGLLLVLLPLPAAMALHAVTQIASNGWRAAFGLRHVRWGIAADYGVGCLAATLAWSAVLYIPSKPVALIAFGLSPFLLMALPAAWKPDPGHPWHAMATGVASMSLMLLTGVAGPLLDRVFLGGRLDRHAIVATKAVCQVQGHALKLVYFGGLAATPGILDSSLVIGAVAAAALGTVLAQPLLRAMTEGFYRLWAGRLVTGIALTYVAQGTWLLLWP
ncbi:MAG TPA: TSUP family transporter [Falsiroseomonas sp.]|jgi:uncharacterized membrane protein YfcA|nr:TSUP family transporter [Falsiroseomonas sp.]